MNIYLEHWRIFWLKFKRRALQYTLDALKNPTWILMFCLARIQVFRSLGIYISKYDRHQVAHSGNSIFPKVDVDLAVERLTKDGLFVGINLPDDKVLKILKFAQLANYFGNANTQFSFFLHEKDKAELKYQQKFVTAHHLNPSLSCPAVREIAEDPKIREIAARYLETNPILIETRIWWTFVVRESVDESLSLPHNFHYDIEDYRFIKFMFYLKNIDRSSGPHVCVKGSHKKKKLRDQFSLFRKTTEREIFNYYGSEKVKTICGPAGLGFVEDFYCFHRGTLPISQNRLILEVKFAMNAYDRISKF